MRGLMLLVLSLAAALALVPSAAVADGATHTYMLEMEGPNFGSAAPSSGTRTGDPLLAIKGSPQVVATSGNCA